MYTVISDYYATGEGRTVMVLISSGSSYYALSRFTDIFGSYYTIGADVVEGVKLDFPGSEFVIPESIRKNKPLEEANFEYHASFHFNAS